MLKRFYIPFFFDKGDYRQTFLGFHFHALLWAGLEEVKLESGWKWWEHEDHSKHSASIFWFLVV